MSDMDEFLDLVLGQSEAEEEVNTLHEYVEMDIHKFAELFPEIEYLKIGDEFEGGEIVEIEEVAVFVDFYQIAYQVLNDDNEVIFTYFEGFDLDREKVLELLNDENFNSNGSTAELMQWLEELNQLWENAQEINEPEELEKFFTKEGYTVIIVE